MNLGVLPAPSAGPRLQLSVERDSLRIEAGAYGLLPLHSRYENSATIRYSALIGVVSICTVWGSMITWGGCLGGEAGALFASAEDISDPRSQTDLWLAPQLALHVGFRKGPFSIQLKPGAGVPLIRPLYRIEPYGVVYQPEPVYGSIDFLVGLRL